MLLLGSPSVLPVTGGPMRMVMVSSASSTTPIGKPITITMPGTGSGPKTVTITGKPGTTAATASQVSLRLSSKIIVSFFLNLRLLGMSKFFFY